MPPTILGTGLGTILGTPLGSGASLIPATPENAMLALSPSHQFRADTATMSGSNLATLPNRRGSDSLVVTGGTLAAPTPDALFNGALSLTFNGTQWLDSNLPASAWKMLHDGSGVELFLAFAPTTFVPSQQFFVSTSDSSNGPGTSLRTSTAAEQTVRIGNGGAFSGMGSAGGSLTVNTATLWDYYLSTSSPVAAASFRGGAVVATLVGPPSVSTSNPLATLRLGASNVGGLPASMQFCELLVFPRVLHEYERQIVREYFADRYGIAAPLLTGLERDVMSLLPFSWPRADVYTSSAGKVTQILDKARPGHVFAQGTTGNQGVNPTADAAMNNQLTIPFVNASAVRYTSNLAAAWWKFMHTGTGQTSYFAGVPTSISAATQWFMGTRNAFGGGTDIGAQVCRNAAQLIQGVLTINAGNVWTGATATNYLTVGTGLVTQQKYLRGAGSPEWRTRVNGAEYANGDSLLVPSANNPPSPLVIGSLPNGTGAIDMRFAEALIFDRALPAAHEARVAAYHLSQYGKAA